MEKTIRPVTRKTTALCKNIKILSFVLLLSMVYSTVSFAQNCTANAGGNLIVCGSTTTLTGTVSGTLGSGAVTWSLISGPATPVIVSPNSLTTNVTGMTADGNYVFQLSQPCGTGTAVSQVTITAHPRPASFTAGADKTGICATVGAVTLDGVIPSGFTGSWSTYNIYSQEWLGTSVTTNSSFSSTTTGTPTFSLVNKANHPIDPAYNDILTITSADGICIFKDTATVRFCPNPALNVANISKCIDGNSFQFFDLPNDPAFTTNTPGSAGAAVNGTTVTLNVISQPTGGNITFDKLISRRVYVTGANVIGSYNFSFTVSNCCGTVTSPVMTFTVTGVQPQNVNFQPSGHGAPEQLVVYSASASGGETHCGIAGTATPELFYFDLDPIDNPVITTTTVTSTGILPPGASTPIITQTGMGTSHRTVSVNPGTSGWKVGTYKFNIVTGAGACTRSQAYYIHISDNSRTALFVPNFTVCYPGAGAISANIPLPTVYQGVVNSSYFQDLGAYYNFQVISRPAGSSVPVFPASNLRRINLNTVTVSNLDKPGDYIIRIIPFSGNGAGPFLDQEYACSGITPLPQYDFTIHLDQVINANAGSDQTPGCITNTSLSGNATGAGTGLWAVASSPSGTTPSFSNATNPNTNVSGLTLSGQYAFTWTLTTTLGCATSDTVLVINNCPLPINFLYFEAAQDGNTSLLRWATASELNNKKFDIERSIDANNWTAIGSVNSSNSNNNSEVTYSFTDRDPQQGNNYYRLKQVDIDGKFVYSVIRTVHVNAKQKSITVFPNPAKKTINITFPQTMIDQPISIAIVTIDGKTMVKQQCKNSGGTQQIDINKLAAGFYILQVVGQDEVFTKSFQVIK